MTSPIPLKSINSLTFMLVHTGHQQHRQWLTTQAMVTPDAGNCTVKSASMDFSGGFATPFPWATATTATA